MHMEHNGVVAFSYVTLAFLSPLIVGYIYMLYKAYTTTRFPFVIRINILMIVANSCVIGAVFNYRKIDLYK